MAKEIILGIDLGTTNSVVSYLQADGTVKGIALRIIDERFALRLAVGERAAIPFAARSAARQFIPARVQVTVEVNAPGIGLPTAVIALADPLFDGRSQLLVPQPRGTVKRDLHAVRVDKGDDMEAYVLYALRVAGRQHPDQIRAHAACHELPRMHRALHQDVVGGVLIAVPYDDDLPAVGGFGQRLGPDQAVLLQRLQVIEQPVIVVGPPGVAQALRHDVPGMNIARLSRGHALHQACVA